MVRQGGSAGRVDLGCNRRGGSIIGTGAVDGGPEVVDDDPRPEFGEEMGMGPTDAAAGTGDDRDPAVEAVRVQDPDLRP